MGWPWNPGMSELERSPPWSPLPSFTDREPEVWVKPGLLSLFPQKPVLLICESIFLRSQHRISQRGWDTRMEAGETGIDWLCGDPAFVPFWTWPWFFLLILSGSLNHLLFPLCILLSPFDTLCLHSPSLLIHSSVKPTSHSLPHRTSSSFPLPPSSPVIPPFSAHPPPSSLAVGSLSISRPTWWNREAQWLLEAIFFCQV